MRAIVVIAIFLPMMASLGCESVSTITPDDGYELDTLTFTPKDGSATDISSTKQFEMPDADVVIDATFKAIPYKVTVTAEPSGAGTAKSDITTATVGEIVKLTATPKDGYQFKEWQVVSGGATVKGDEFSMPASDVVVKAIFEPVPPATKTVTYTVTFDANGGKGKMASQEVSKGDSAKLNSNEFKRDGYVFNGWNTKANGKGTAYKNKAEVTPKADMTLYAQWKKKSSSSKTETPAKHQTTQRKPSQPSRTLPKTSDPTAAAPVLAMALTGLATLSLGISKKRR